MALANELYSAAELTGVARAELEIAEGNGLAQWLPNEYILSNTATFTKGESGLHLDGARYRAYDAAPELGRQEEAAEEVALKLPAISDNSAISEETTINLRSVSDETLRSYVERALRRSIRKVQLSVNKQRARVLTTGQASVKQRNFKFADDFGRDPRLTTQVPVLWSDETADRLTQLANLRDLYVEITGVEPGALVTTRRVKSALVRGAQFAVELSNGQARPGNEAEVRSFLDAFGLPPIYTFDERSRQGSLLRTDSVLFLPAPVGTESPEATELGSTVWGLTATALADGFEIEESDLPGIVAGVYAPERVPYVHEVMSDAVVLPVLKDANLSMCVKVLPDA